MIYSSVARSILFFALAASCALAQTPGTLVPQTLPPLADAEKNAVNKVNGCVSQVWLVTERDRDMLTYRGESDAMIVRGLAAILIALYSGRPANEIAETDAIALFDEMGLREHLSTQRSNGLVAMVNRIRSEARALAA